MDEPLVILKYFGDADWEQRELSRFGQVRYTKCTTVEDLRNAVRDVEVLLADVDVPVTREVIQAANRLRLVQCYSSGYDYVDVEVAARAGALVCNLPDYSAPAVAELTLALMFSLARNICLANRLTRDGRWPKRDPVMRGVELAGRTLGIVGFGRIGRLVASKAAGLGMPVLVCSRHATDEEIARVPAERCDLEPLLRRSDFVSLHSKLSDASEYMIGEAELAIMKPSAYLVNVARGRLVREDALHDALSSGRIAGAALDVLEVEPPLPENRLLHLPNVIVTPHVGWNTVDSPRRLREAVKATIKTFLSGARPSNAVNDPAAEPA